MGVWVCLVPSGGLDGQQFFFHEDEEDDRYAELFCDLLHKVMVANKEGSEQQLAALEGL